MLVTTICCWLYNGGSLNMSVQNHYIKFGLASWLQAACSKQFQRRFVEKTRKPWTTLSCIFISNSEILFRFFSKPHLIDCIIKFSEPLLRIVRILIIANCGFPKEKDFLITCILGSFLDILSLNHRTMYVFGTFER